MYQFHYDYVLKTFDNVKLLFTDTDSLVYEIKNGNVNVKLLFMDTDSLVYEIKNGNVNDKCFKDKHMFDFSGYSEDSVYYDASNKSVG